jgi:hypothetical protein
MASLRRRREWQLASAESWWTMRIFSSPPLYVLGKRGFRLTLFGIDL